MAEAEQRTARSRARLESLMPLIEADPMLCGQFALLTARQAENQSTFLASDPPASSQPL